MNWDRSWICWTSRNHQCCVLTLLTQKSSPFSHGAPTPICSASIAIFTWPTVSLAASDISESIRARWAFCTNQGEEPFKHLSSWYDWDWNVSTVGKASLKIMVKHFYFWHFCNVLVSVETVNYPLIWAFFIFASLLLLSFLLLFPTALPGYCLAFLFSFL